MKLKIALATLAFAGFPFSRADDKPAPEQPVVQIAILLDNSGSMNGLISQAKTELWNIVNEFVSAKQGGKAPRLQVALFEYGVNDQPAAEGYIRFLSPLTDDLDKLSEKLFAIHTRSSGSNEYCGWVIKDAVEKLEWDKSSKTYKAIFIAGNEPFTQGSVDYRSACKAAIEKGIIVNTIHCGPESEGIAGMWKDGSALADGRFLNINQNAIAAVPKAPQDRELAEWNVKLNGTYIAVGTEGARGLARQTAQDSNAANLPAAAAGAAFNGRVASKASANYFCAWDLIDSSKQKDFDITKIKDEDLPEEMRKMTLDEKKAHIAKKAGERADIQKRIGELAKEREKFIAEEMKKDSKESTLSKAVATAVREQAEKKGVTFEAK
jgi:hypothetical protein